MNQLIKNVQVYNTFTQSFEKKNVYIQEDKFYYICDDEPLESQEVIDGQGKYMIPGLIDIHMHIESSMTVPGEFSKAVLPHGVTTVVADPHEIANVFGIRGIETMISNDTTLDIFYGIPSSVPSTNEYLETTGGKIDAEIQLSEKQQSSRKNLYRSGSWLWKYQDGAPGISDWDRVL